MTTESTPDFKARIAQIMRLRETGKQWSVVGGPRANDCVLRKPRKNQYANKPA